MVDIALDPALDAITDEQQDEMQNKYLVFLLDNQDFAISIKYVVDIINVQPITRVPNCPDYVKGITNLRGKVIPIVDVRLRFGKMSDGYTERTCIIVVEVRDLTVGLIIDSVSEVITLAGEDIAPPPDFNTGMDSRFICGIGKIGSSIKLLLDCRAVLDDYALSAEGDEIEEGF